MPFDRGGLTSCAVITAVHAWRLAELPAGETAVVLGAGGIGQILVQLLTAAGVRTVAVGRSPESLQMAIGFGAALALPADDPSLVSKVRGFAGAEADGVHTVFELIGRAGTMRLASELVRRQGKIVVIGEEAEFPAVDTIAIAQRELQILGSRNGGMQDAREALRLMAERVIRPPIAVHFQLEHINQAFDLVRQGGASGRVVVTLGK